MRYLVVWFIKDYVPKGMVIKTHALYGSIYAQFPKECEKLGLTDSGPIEPKWKNQIRWGLRDAKDQKLIKHVGLPKSGEWQRI
jgi:hypothetical protein